ncbi:MAG: DNA phosphorothioation system sulfurtransferase DndC [Cytophagaceae bacterium]|nr:DNA phosphorothioation system sulfurtransferase DndC [Cytophagaceae bacterium]
MSLILSFIESEIQDQYLYDDNPRPWIIGFSGGKDSTMLLQVVWNALLKIPAEIRNRPIYVICNDTLVENPKIVSFIKRTLDVVQKAAAEQSIPITVHRTTPRLEDTFWVNLLGRGYPAPNNTFRWCTERLKINPTTRFIQEKISEKGEAIILLGTRSEESQSRARSMKRHAMKTGRLRKHLLPNAFVYAPLQDITTNEVWQYLMKVDAPWGGKHKELHTLYRNANAGDCPLVIDETTPSCGQSRFGCWVCTVVSRDKSMEGLVLNGDDWMEPLMEFRDVLIDTRNDRSYREMRRRTDSPFKEDDPTTWGPYTPDTRAKFLTMLLRAQREIQLSQGEDMQLISHQELVAIQLTWYRDGIFNHKVADIYNAINEQQLDMSKHEEKFKREEQLLRDVCADNPDDFNLIQELLTLQKNKSLLVKKRNLKDELERHIELHLAKTKRTPEAVHA